MLRTQKGLCIFFFFCFCSTHSGTLLLFSSSYSKRNSIRDAKLLTGRLQARANNLHLRTQRCNLAVPGS